MTVFGLSITRQKAGPPPGTVFSTPSAGRGGWFRVLEPFTGAWQRNIEQTPETLLAFHAVYACVTLIASDIAKLRIKLVEQDRDGIWNETTNSAYSPVLRRPNAYQDRIQFITHWMLSKLIHGNTYVLLNRDQNRVVREMHVLDPTRVQVRVAPNGDIYYALGQDNLSGVDGASTTVPASEIIHDRMPGLYHPLCGSSPLTACYLPALQALRGQQNSADTLANGARPGGVLTSAAPLSDEQIAQIQTEWQANYGGDNQGRVAVLTADLKYQDLKLISNVDMQLIEQLKLSGENVCSAFHVPGFKVGIGAMPAYNSVEAANILYYSDCLQYHYESIESLLDFGLSTGNTLGTEFDLESLLRMDTSSRSTAAKEAVNGGMSYNEARRRFFDLGPVKGGESPLAQQQNYSLEALAKRDAKADPFETATSKPDTPAPDAMPADAANKSALLVPRALLALQKAMAA